MSGPNSVGRNEAPYRPIVNPPTTTTIGTAKTERAASRALRQKPKEPHHRKIPKPCQPVLAPRRSPSTNPIENRPPTATRRIHTPQKGVEKTEPPVLKNPPQSFFQFAHLFLAGICTLIGAVIYALYRFFNTQPKEENDHRERLPSFVGEKDKTLQYPASQYNPHVMQNLDSLKTEHLITGVRPIRGDGITLDKKVYKKKLLESMKEGLTGFGNKNNEPLVPLSEQVAAQINKLKSHPYNIEKWRPIAGDGNCYYRATMFGLIEQIIKNGKRDRFSNLAEIFKSEELTQSLLKADQYSSHKCFVESLEEAASNNKWKTLDDFKKDIVDLKTGLDEAMVRAARYLVALEIEKIAENKKQKNEIELTEKINLGSDCPLASCCEKIRMMGNYETSYHINTGILNRLLGFSLTLYTVSKDGILRMKPKDPKNEEVSILLVMEKMHYVLVYPKTPSPSEEAWMSLEQP